MAADYETHRCEGSLAARCSIRRYHEGPPLLCADGRWNLWHLDYDTEWMADYMSHVAAIGFCPWCGERLVDK